MLLLAATLSLGTAVAALTRHSEPTASPSKEDPSPPTTNSPSTANINPARSPI